MVNTWWRYCQRNPFQQKSRSREFFFVSFCRFIIYLNSFFSLLLFTYLFHFINEANQKCIMEIQSTLRKRFLKSPNKQTSLTLYAAFKYHQNCCSNLADECKSYRLRYPSRDAAPEFGSWLTDLHVEELGKTGIRKQDVYAVPVVKTR